MNKQVQRIYYQGQKGAYSWVAAKYLFPESELIGKDVFSKAFSAPVKNVANLAVLPVDNTVIGSIFEVYDLLFAHEDLKIIGELMLKIDHNLLAKKGAELAKIKKVYSHTKALDQCRDLFKKYKNLEPVVYEDTAGAAKFVSESNKKDIAAIAGKSAAEVYGLQVIKPHVQSNGENYTRFVVLANKKHKDIKAKDNQYKTSIVFAASHKPGSLLSCMKPFADSGFNLTKIESRPLLGSPWQYLFYLDFEHEGTNGEIKEVLKEVRPHTQILRILGTYPKGETIEE